MHAHDPNERFPRLHFPLRGLSGKGADAAIRESLADMPGILSIDVSTTRAVVEVRYDPAMVTPDTLRVRLSTAGVKKAGPP